MKLSLIYCVTTPNGTAWLATDGSIYYVKGVHSSIPKKFDSFYKASACYIGTLQCVIEEYADGCETPDMCGTEVTL